MEDIKKVAVVGAGIMGHGISQVCAQAGYEVSMIEIEREALQTALSKIKYNLETLVKNHVITEGQAARALSRIKWTLDRSEAVRDADFIIEAIKEDMDLKKQVFKELDEECPEHAIFATNTSRLASPSLQRKGKKSLLVCTGGIHLTLCL
ncbi:MAG: 3-hydroxybutyryl-CoA dehydrogenase [Candidatus Bathyarchaeota archaeon BA1]|nr:MAG: 3-hydroxybutyryl-CoA dehydrogenase [Candidatus Bathyarchaeota archaeon BA1]